MSTIWDRCIKTVTHAFVPTADTQMSSSEMHTYEHYSVAKETYSGNAIGPENGTSPLGKAVCLAGTHKTVYTYSLCGT